MHRVDPSICFFCSAVRSSAGPSGGVRENTLLRLEALVGRAGNFFAAAMAAEVRGGGVVIERALGNPVVLPVLLVVLLSKGD